ncbi:MAG: copper amine oxidase N-terminal domain-containing protein [Defluviitaleaceae bacterium]|nr:copper amine oxidase N-terminal domain-containing protein [Defluviitaleaceae bacterium]
MKTMKRIAALLITVITTAVIAINVFGGSYEYDRANYHSVTGKVEGIEKIEDVGYRIHVTVGESSAYFNTYLSTFFLGEFPKEGDTVTGFFDANRPMITIYPPQYTATVIVNGDVGSVYVDRFRKSENEGELLSADGMRRLNVAGSETKIISQGGQDASEWDLEDRLLVVVYDVATRSLPPLIFAPKKIVVMYEIAVHPGPEPIDNGFIGIVPPIGDISGMEVAWYNIVINGVGLPDETYYSAGDAMFPTHVPLRAVAEFMDPDIDIRWNRGNVRINGSWGEISFSMETGETYTVIADGRTIRLNQPIVMHNDRVQVPLSFFRDVVGMKNAYSIGGTVFIDNFELMQ